MCVWKDFPPPRFFLSGGTLLPTTTNYPGIHTFFLDNYLAIYTAPHMATNAPCTLAKLGLAACERPSC